MSGATHPAAQRHVPEGLNPQQCCCENSNLTRRDLRPAVYVPKRLYW